MPNCNIIGCGVKRSKNHPNLTLHRLPTNEKRRKKWLEIIGLENINLRTKNVFFCSHHFDNSCFNHTLNITKLRDDALPSPIYRMQTSSPELETSAIRTQDPEVLIEYSDTGVDDVAEDVKISIVSEDALHVKITHMGSIADTPVISTEDLGEQTNKNIVICKLKNKCEDQKQKITKLQQMVGRQKKKISDFLSIVRKLKRMKSDHTYI